MSYGAGPRSWQIDPARAIFPAATSHVCDSYKT